jgi:hypothetical protein
VKGNLPGLMKTGGKWKDIHIIITSPKQYKTFCFVLPNPSAVPAQKQLPWQMWNMLRGGRGWGFFSMVAGNSLLIGKHFCSLRSRYS